jgi:hypothetical protein
LHSKLDIFELEFLKAWSGEAMKVSAIYPSKGSVLKTM